MREKELLKTNLLVSMILTVGFALTAILSYRVNFQASMDSMEQVSSLTAQGIYYQISGMLTRPVNISLTMAHDSFLAEHLLKEPEQGEDGLYLEAIRNYLDTYREKYRYDSVFLVSVASGHYYNFNGLDRVLEPGDPENEWYFSFLERDEEYYLNVDNDQVAGMDNEITVFVNCKVPGPDGSVLGVVGVGIKVDYLKSLLREYEDNYNVRASLVNGTGEIEISSTYTGYEKVDWFTVYKQEDIREQVLGWRESHENLELWTGVDTGAEKESFVVSRFIPELSWNLVVEQDTGHIVHQMRVQIYRTALILLAVVVTIMVIITAVIRNFNRQLVKLAEERQAVFKKATEQLYESIFELNLTKNSYVGKNSEEYFKNLGAGGVPYDQGLRLIAEQQIKEEFRAGYLEMFSPESAIREYENGKNHLQYDFMICQDGRDYHWMRVDAYLFYSEEDRSVHMFAYRKNMDDEKRAELQASIDEMTGFLTKKATERMTDQQLLSGQGKMFAFFIFDIDEFKQVNDCFGHAFGDNCINSFTEIIREHFRKGDILGRIGGDEFAVIIQVPDMDFVERKAKELCDALEYTYAEQEKSYELSASIGIAVAPRDGNSYEELYQKADAALYQTKQRGKNGYTIYG